jgi:DNA-binding transcriptional ArsR family regulator
MPSSKNRSAEANMGSVHVIVESSDLLSLHYFHKSGNMESEPVILALAALAQSTRLDVFRLLVRREPAGIPAGEIARELAVPANTMSAHLSVLMRAGLIRSERRSRSIIYRANLEQFRAVATFLLKDCCGSRPEVCGPLIADLTPCCPQKESING